MWNFLFHLGSLLWGGLGVGSVCVPPFLKVTVDMLEDSASFQLSTASPVLNPRVVIKATCVLSLVRGI